MKFGDKFTEYLHGEGERFRDKNSHVEYKRLKKVLKKCRLGHVHENGATVGAGEALGLKAVRCISRPCDFSRTLCSSETCPVCDNAFFYELSKEISAIVGCFSSRARRLLHLHLASGFQRYLWRIKHCFADDHLAMIHEGRNLVSYVAMNALAVRKILKKYDKIHKSVNGRNFKTKLQAKHIELLKSPWLIELCAFQINLTDSEHGCVNGEIFPECSCDFTGSDPVIRCTLPDSVKLEFSLTCPICLDTVFDAVSLGCGHIFCKSCACTGAAVPTVEGVKTANRRTKFPICRQMGVYTDAVHLSELSLLVKKRCGGYWDERLQTERAERVKQAKEHWDLQSRFILGF